MKINKWIEKSEQKQTNLKERTQNLYIYLKRKYICPYFCRRKRIGTQNLEAFLVELVKKGLSTNSIKMIWRLLKNLLKANMSQNQMDALKVTDILVPKTKERKVEAFSISEQRKIEKRLNIQKHNKHVGILLSLYLGMRLGEVLALRWEDVDFIHKTIYVKRTVYIQDKKPKYTLPKTKSSERTIPIPTFLEDILKQIKKQNKSEFVVAHKEGQVLPRTYQAFFYSLQQKAGLSKTRGFHSLRHTFATRALECGMDVKSLADVLGHKNPNVTLNRYAHSMMDYKKSMLNKIGKLYD